MIDKRCNCLVDRASQRLAVFDSRGSSILFWKRDLANPSRALLSSSSIKFVNIAYSWYLKYSCERRDGRKQRRKNGEKDGRFVEKHGVKVSIGLYLKTL